MSIAVFRHSLSLSGKLSNLRDAGTALGWFWEGPELKMVSEMRTVLWRLFSQNVQMAKHTAVGISKIDANLLNCVVWEEKE